MGKPIFGGTPQPCLLFLRSLLVESEKTTTLYILRVFGFGILK
jgi:hypothetical protein